MKTIKISIVIEDTEDKKAQHAIPSPKFFCEDDQLTTEFISKKLEDSVEPLKWEVRRIIK